MPVAGEGAVSEVSGCGENGCCLASMMGCGPGPNLIAAWAKNLHTIPGCSHLPALTWVLCSAQGLSRIGRQREPHEGIAELRIAQLIGADLAIGKLPRGHAGEL